jgi:hypothetical protein
VWQVLEFVIDVLDVVTHWRFYACFLGGLAIGWLALRTIPDASLGQVVAGAIAVVGFVAGVVWEWKN